MKGSVCSVMDLLVEAKVALAKPDFRALRDRPAAAKAVKYGDSKQTLGRVQHFLQDASPNACELWRVAALAFKQVSQQHEAAVLVAPIRA